MLVHTHCSYATNAQPRPGARRSCRAVGLWLSLVIAWMALDGCASSVPSVHGARDLLAKGELKQACAMANRLVRDAGLARGPRLAAIRCWIDCMARRGRLDEVRQWASRGVQEDPELMYARALIGVASSPEQLPRALALLTRVARAWPQEAEVPYRSGLLMLADERAKEALPLLEKACHLSPRSRCSVALAHALLDVDRVRDALVEARKVVELGPRRVDLQRGRALIMRIRRRRVVPAGAKAAYQRALDSQDRPNESIAALEPLLADYPDLAVAHTLLGLAQLRLGNIPNALTALRRAAQLDPLDATNPLYLATVEQRRMNWERAVALFRRALELDPFGVRAARALGRMLEQLKRYREAAAAFDYLVALTPEHGPLRFAGRAHLAAGSLTEAGERFGRLLKLEPRDYEANLRLGQIMLGLYRKAPSSARPGLLDRARAYANQAIKAGPDTPEARQLLIDLEQYAQ